MKNDDQNAKILEKIKKLFALAESPNEAEAASAMAKAHELLTAHNLGLEDLKDSKSEVVEEVFAEGQRFPTWKLSLVSAICETNFCALFRRRTDNKPRLCLVGLPHNIRAAELMIDYLISAVQRLSQNAQDKNAYKLGLAHTLMERLAELKKKDSDEPQTRALVIRDEGRIKEYFASLGGVKRRSPSRARVSNPDDYHKGRRDGHGISLCDRLE